jgi:hypothetical protein
MTAYFDDLRRKVADLVASTSTDKVLVERVVRLEEGVIDTVDLCTGDREFPTSYRERIQGIIAVHRLVPAGCTLPTSHAQDYLLTMKDHRLFDHLHSAFHDLASERIRTRFGVLTDDPADNVMRRDNHDTYPPGDEDNLQPEPDVETGNVMITVEVHDPHRPLCSRGRLAPTMKMRLELLGTCALSTVDADEIVDLACKKAGSERRVRAQVWYDGKLVQDKGPAEADCGKCRGRWMGRDYLGEMRRAVLYRKLEGSLPRPADLLKLLARARGGK